MTEGLKFQFKGKPVLSVNPPSNKIISTKTALALEEFIPKWLETNIIREITDPIPLHFSIMFMRPKKNGKMRPIIDLKDLNDLLYIPKFKMETVAVIASTISGDLWACSVDLKDAYFHLPIKKKPTTTQVLEDTPDLRNPSKDSKSALSYLVFNTAENPYAKQTNNKYG